MILGKVDYFFYCIVNSKRVKEGWEGGLDRVIMRRLELFFLLKDGRRNVRLRGSVCWGWDLGEER